MLNFTDLTGLGSVALATAATALLMPQTAQFARSLKAALLGIIFVLMLIPFGELPLAGYLRGMTGDLSITALVLMGCALFRPWLGNGTDDSGNRHTLLMLIALAALGLYPMALGAGGFDPYRLGYGDPQFIAALLLMALSAWIWKYYLIALCIAFAILAWTVGWYESGNLWDYLLDPWVAIYALFVIMLHGAKTLLQRGKTLGR